MKKIIILLIGIGIILIAFFTVVYGRNFFTGSKVQNNSMDQNKTDTVSEIAEGPVYITINETTAQPKLSDIKSGYGLIFKNETSKDLEISLDGVIKVDKIKIPADGTASGPIFSTKGEISIISGKNKLGTVNVR